jgi:hypothetical protein
MTTTFAKLPPPLPPRTALFGEMPKDHPGYLEHDLWDEINFGDLRSPTLDYVLPPDDVARFSSILSTYMYWLSEYNRHDTLARALIVQQVAALIAGDTVKAEKLRIMVAEAVNASAKSRASLELSTAQLRDAATAYIAYLARLRTEHGVSRQRVPSLGPAAKVLRDLLTSVATDQLSHDLERIALPSNGRQIGPSIGGAGWRDLLGGFAPPGGLPGGIGILPETGAQSWLGGARKSNGRGTPVSYASGPAKSTNAGSTEGGNGSSSTGPTKDSRPDWRHELSQAQEEAIAAQGMKIIDQNVTGPKGPTTIVITPPKEEPDPMRDPIGLTGNSAIDATIQRHLRLQAGLRATPLGPSRAFTPDAGLNDPDLSGEIDWSLLDPVAPVADGYERSRVRGNARRVGIQHPGILALYPEGGTSGGDGEDDETVQVVERLLMPKEAPPAPQGDPAAHRGQVTAVSGGVRSATLSTLAGRTRSAR